MGGDSEKRILTLPTRKPPVTTYPQESFYTSQRRQEYKSFAKEYLAPVVASGVAFIEEERAAEEAKLREGYAAQVAEAEKTARGQFEADLETKREEAWASFESGLTAEKDKSTFKSDLSAQEAAARSAFEAQLAAERRRVTSEFQAQVKAKRGELVEAPLRVAKREYAMLYKRQMLPRHYRAVKAGAEEAFRTLAETEQEALEQQVSTWETGQAQAFASGIESWKSTELGKREQAVKDWETGQKVAVEEEMKGWESEAKAAFETEISTWKTEHQATLEPQLKEWREAWQPKGIAERMMEIKVPSLDLSGRLAEALGLKGKPKFAPSGSFLGVMQIESFGVVSGKAPEVHPLAMPAGIVASVESLVYGVGQLAGLKTPRMPPTVTGGLISSGFESVMKWQLTPSEELQQIGKMEPAYGAGSIIGDILIAYGIGKAVKAGTKAVKGVAGFIYEESGLKYSHALYEAKKSLLGIEKALPKSPIAAIKESHLAYEFGRAETWLKGKMPWIKMQKGFAEGIMGLPTVPEAEKGAEEFLVKGALGLTADEIKWLPRLQAGLDIMDMTMAPKAAGFGLTISRQVAPTITRAALSEALAETMWITAPAAERWAVRAGTMPSLEEVIVQPPKEAGEQMIKGGRYFDIDLTRALGFSKFPYREAAAGKFYFEKGKLPSMKDLLKGTKAEATLGQLMETPAKIVEPLLPKLAMLPEAAGKISLSQALGVGAVLGVKPLGRARAKPEAIVKPSSLAAVILSLRVEAAAAQKLKVEQISLLKQIMAPSQLLKTVQIQRGVFKPPPLLKPPRKKEEPLIRIKRVAIFGKKPKKKMAGYLYPVLPETKIPKYLRVGLELPRAKGGKLMSSASSFILGKRKTKNVFKQQVRHKRK